MPGYLPKFADNEAILPVLLELGTISALEALNPGLNDVLVGWMIGGIDGGTGWYFVGIVVAPTIGRVWGTITGCKGGIGSTFAGPYQPGIPIVRVNANAIFPPAQ